MSRLALTIRPVTDELLIEVGAEHVHVARVTAGRLVTLQTRAQSGPARTGDVFIGRVERIVPGLQAAFVDIGEHRNGFLHASHLSATEADIGDLLRVGQCLPVQIQSPARAEKGAQLTARVTLSSRFWVYDPSGHGVSLSRKIECDAERRRLASLATDLKTACPRGGLILRTAAARTDSADLESDLQALLLQWGEIDLTLCSAQAPACVWSTGLLNWLMALVLAPSIARITIEDPKVLEQLQIQAGEQDPRRAEHLDWVLHDAGARIFNRYSIAHQIDQALQPRVELQCGGYLVIEHTEAMVVIDVNSGSYLGAADPQSFASELNMEAATEIARQIRLRNLAGIIVIDFVDMPLQQQCTALTEHLQALVAADEVPVILSDVSDLGLIQLTRRRDGPSLQQRWCDPCSRCNGYGHVRSALMTAEAIVRDLAALSQPGPISGSVQVTAAPEVAELLRDRFARALTNAGTNSGKSVQILDDPSYRPERFAIILL